MHDIKVIWGVPDNEIHVLSHFAYSKAPLKSQLTPGAFEVPVNSRRLFEVKELLKKSSKFVKIVENRLGVNMCGAFFLYGCKRDPLWLFGIGMTRAPFLYILGCLWAKQEPLAPFEFRKVSKKLQKYLILWRNHQFSWITQNIGAFCL